MDISHLKVREAANDNIHAYAIFLVYSIPKRGRPIFLLIFPMTGFGQPVLDMPLAILIKKHIYFLIRASIVSTYYVLWRRLTVIPTPGFCCCADKDEARFKDRANFF